MLVLTRKITETIHVNGPCIITLCDVRGDRVRIGVQAEPSVNIVRGELAHEASAAADSSPDPVESA